MWLPPFCPLSFFFHHQVMNYWSEKIRRSHINFSKVSNGNSNDLARLPLTHCPYWVCVAYTLERWYSIYLSAFVCETIAWWGLDLWRQTLHWLCEQGLSMKINFLPWLHRALLWLMIRIGSPLRSQAGSYTWPSHNIAHSKTVEYAHGSLLDQGSMDCEQSVTTLWSTHSNSKSNLINCCVIRAYSHDSHFCSLSLSSHKSCH